MAFAFVKLGERLRRPAFRELFNGRDIYTVIINVVVDGGHAHAQEMPVNPDGVAAKRR